MKILLAVFCLFLNNRITYSQTYDFKSYGLEEGLPQATVFSICQDNLGNIWMGTGGGAAKFNGSAFDNYTETKGLVDNYVYSIHLMKNGNLLFSTGGGISIYNGNSFVNYTAKDGLPSNRVFKAIEDSNGIIWIATEKGVCTLTRNKIVPFNENSILKNESIWTIFEDSNHNLWFGTQNHGAIKFNPTTNKFDLFNESNGLSDNYAWAIAEDSVGYVYIGTPLGIRKISKNNVIKKVPQFGNDQNGFYSIRTDEDNTMWITGPEGLYKYKNDIILESFSVEKGLPSNIIMSSLIDREGNLWLGTSSLGCTKLSSFAFKTTENFLPPDYVSSIFQDSKKNIWIGINEYGVTKISNDGIQTFQATDKINPITDNNIQAITEDSKGNMIFGNQIGLNVYDGKKFYSYKISEDDENKNFIYCLLTTNEESILIGTGDGLFRFKDKKFSPEALNSSALSKEDKLIVLCIAQDSSNAYWLGTHNGVIKYTGKSAVLFNKKSGFSDKKVGSIVIDKKQNIWFGTDEGVFHYDYHSFKNISEKDGLASNKIYLLLPDENNLWIGTNKGIDKIDLLNYYSKKKISIKHYGKEEGFKGIECNRNAAIKDHEGNLWFGTIKGVNIFNPKFEKINIVEPITQITGLRLFYEKADKELINYSEKYDSISNLPINLKLPYDKNHITFDFIGICMTIPTKVRYQFMLEGADNKWSPITSETKATYSPLNPGEYTFYLKAMNNDGLWNKKPVSFSFTILPPWWRTWWFYTISTILFIGCVVAFVRIRTQQLTKAKIVLENQVRIRTSQLREEKEKVETINKEVVAQKAIIEAKNQDITDSIKYAKNIQEAILPPLNSLYQELKDIFIFYQPKDIVSGDFYWFQKRNNKKLIAAVDCTGHGVPGAFMSIVGNTLLNEIVSEKNILEHAQILNELHNGVKEALKQDKNQHERQDGMDIALCALNEDNSILEFSGANRPLWIFRKNSETICEVIKPDKLPIGGMEIDNKRIYTNHKINVEKGDIVYLFSDGFADQFGGTKGKKFMVGNLQKKLLEIYQLPLAEQEKILRDTFHQWKGAIDQVDDVLVMAFKIS